MKKPKKCCNCIYFGESVFPDAPYGSRKFILHYCLSELAQNDARTKELYVRKGYKACKHYRSKWVVE